MSKVIRPPPRLEHVADLHLDLAPIVPGGTTPIGVTNWFEIIGGTLESVPSTVDHPPLSATILRGGGDYSTLHMTDAAITLDVHVLARTNDTHQDVFKFHNTGVIGINERTKDIFGWGNASKAKSTEFGELGVSVLESINCNTGSPLERHGWLNYEVLVAQGRLLCVEGKAGLVAIELRVYRVLSR